MSKEKAAQAPIRLNVKLARQIAAKDPEGVLAGTPGLKSVVQTFPDEKDEELSRLLMVEVEPSAAQLALEKLKENPEIEYAEPTATRKLIR